MSQSTLISPPSPTVALYNDRPATTSREVAKFFGKRHDHVVRDIRNLIANTPKTFHAPNFGEMFEDVEIGNGAVRQDAVFLLFRDGFMLLVMGYTGKKAMQIKIAYSEKLFVAHEFVWIEKRSSTLVNNLINTDYFFNIPRSRTRKYTSFWSFIV